jgi:uncharacterized membrane protein
VTEEKHHHDEAFFMTGRRMESLADCIFAFGMTLLVINLGLPDPKSAHDNETIRQYLLQQLRFFDDYALSFVLLALFWVAHHQLFHFIKQTDRIFLLISVFVLMFVALIPLTTSILAHFGHLPVANLVFDANLFIVGCLFYVSWIYAERRGLLDTEANRSAITMGKLRSLLAPAAAIVAYAFSFAVGSWSTTIYIAIPLILLVIRIRDKKQRSK